jgi:N-acetylglucosamine-6-sulfatase
VDRSIGLLLDAVPNNTLLIVTSDNGFLLGEHPWRGKNVPYNESIRVPLVLRCVRCPLVEPGTEDLRIALNIDLAGTILDALAFHRTPSLRSTWPPAEPLAPVGRSLLRDRWTRTAFVLEHLGTPGGIPSYCGVRTADHLFVHYADGFEEVYDERRDPWEMDNIAADQLAPTDTLRAQAVALCDPVPPGFA